MTKEEHTEFRTKGVNKCRNEMLQSLDYLAQAFGGSPSVL